MPTLKVHLADRDTRQSIYAMRHEVYARELGQHATRQPGLLTDDLDQYNQYIVVSQGQALRGFVSITPPIHPQTGQPARLSVDKYVSRQQIPFEIDPQVYEVRLLTVMSPHRHSATASLLMWAALRWIESQGGQRIVAIGRRQVLGMYRKIGFEPAGVTITSGAVQYELMTAHAHALRRHAKRYGTMFSHLSRRIDWQLDMPFDDNPDSPPPAPPCYHGGAFFKAIGERFDTLHHRHQVINADVLDAWFDPSPRVLQALQEHLPWLLRTSPPTGCEGMIQAIAERRGVDGACVLPGAGSSDLIFLALRQMLNSRSRVLILDPMYGEYAHVLEHVIGCKVDRLALRPADRYDPDLAELQQQVHRHRHDMVLLVNPNSPTGRYVERDKLIQLIDSLPGRTRIWIDETYIDYVDSRQSLEPLATARPNVIVCKSMSKVYALSGARAAYLVASRQTIDTLRGFSPPWAVSLPGQLAAVAALDDPAYYLDRWRQTHELRHQLATGLRAMGMTVIDGVANFLLCHLPPPRPRNGPTAARLIEACREKQLFLRDASGMGTRMGERAIRIAVKDQAVNQRMLDILADALAQA